MAIWVCSLKLAALAVERLRPERVISLLEPEGEFPSFRQYGPDRHLKVGVDDISQMVEGRAYPTHEHAEALTTFISGWNRNAPLLVHCWAGVSRSTAAAYIAACMHNPEMREIDVAMALRRASRSASPNRLLVKRADDILGRQGRMVAAIDRIGHGELAPLQRAFRIDLPEPAADAGKTDDPSP